MTFNKISKLPLGGAITDLPRENHGQTLTLAQFVHIYSEVRNQKTPNGQSLTTSCPINTAKLVGSLQTKGNTPCGQQGPQPQSIGPQFHTFVVLFNNHTQRIKNVFGHLPFLQILLRKAYIIKYYGKESRTTPSSPNKKKH